MIQIMLKNKLHTAQFSKCEPKSVDKHRKNLSLFVQRAVCERISKINAGLNEMTRFCIMPRLFR